MEANYFYLAILHFLNENGGSCSVDKLKENLPSLRDFILKGQPDLGDIDCDSLWAQILKSSNILSKQGYIIKKSGIWHITVKGLKYMNDNHGIKKEKKTIGKFIKNIPNIWKVIIVVIPIIIGYLTYKVGYLNYIEIKRSNEIAIQEKEELQAKYIAEKQPIFEILRGIKIVENKYDKGYNIELFGDTICYDTLAINNIGTPIKELYQVAIGSVLQLINEDKRDDGIVISSKYLAYPKWYEWEYTGNKTGIIYKASSYENYWALTLLDLYAEKGCIDDSTNYFFQVRDFILIRYIDIMGNKQEKTYCDNHEISLDDFNQILNLYLEEGVDIILPNRELGDTNLERVIYNYPNLLSFGDLRDSLKYVFPPELRVLNGFPKYSKIIGDKLRKKWIEQQKQD